MGHHVSKELILKAVSGHSKIDEGRLGLHLWLVVRVGQLGVKNQAEQRVVLHLFVTNLDVSAIKGSRTVSRIEYLIREYLIILPG